MMSTADHAASISAPKAGAPETDMDCETAALYRAWMRPLFERASDWDMLVTGLREKGYALAIRDGRLFLTRSDTGQRFCSVRFLGTNMRDLAGRLGRPVIRARLDRAAAGEFVNPSAMAH